MKIQVETQNGIKEKGERIYTITKYWQSCYYGGQNLAYEQQGKMVILHFRIWKQYFFGEELGNNLCSGPKLK